MQAVDEDMDETDPRWGEMDEGVWVQDWVFWGEGGVELMC